MQRQTLYIDIIWYLGDETYENFRSVCSESMKFLPILVMSGVMTIQYVQVRPALYLEESPLYDRQISHHVSIISLGDRTSTKSVSFFK